MLHNIMNCWFTGSAFKGSKKELQLEKKKQKKILAFVIEENSKIKCNAEDGSCKLLDYLAIKLKLIKYQENIDS